MNKWDVFGKIMLIAIVLIILAVASFASSIDDYRDGEHELHIAEAINLGNQELIEVDMSDEDVELYVSESNQLEINYYRLCGSKSQKEKKERSFTVEETKNKIKIYTKDTWSFNFNFGLFWGFSDYQNKLEVGIPEEYAKDLVVSTSSGDINLADFIMSDVELNASSGNIEVLTLDCANLDIDTSSGEIYIEKVENVKELNTHASSGDITLESVIAKTMILGTSSGNAEISGEADHFEFNASSGNLSAIDFYAKESNIDLSSGEVYMKGDIGNTDVETSSGNITLIYETFNYDITAEASSGQIEIYLPKDAEFNVKCDYSSGDFDTDFELVKNSDKHHDFSGSIGETENIIYLDTTSGNSGVYMAK